MLPPYIYIDETETLRWLAVELSQQPLLAFDIESNGLHAYRERVCLLQISTRENDFIVDPFAIDDMSPVGALLADPNIEIVFHAGEYDMRSLRRDFDFRVTHLFDTMFAARVLGERFYGLNSLMSKYFDIEMDKSHQTDDWARRPLDAESLRYAQMDTHYLPMLRDALQADLQKLNRYEEACEIFEEATQVDMPPPTFDPEGYWRLGRPYRLKRRQMSALRNVYLLREELAMEADLPVFKIMSNRLLVSIAQANPRNQKQLENVRGMQRPIVDQYGPQILEAVRTANGKKLPAPPPLPHPPPPDLTNRYTAIHQWRKARGESRGVSSEVVMPKEVMWQLAKQMPTSIDELKQIDGLGPIRRQLYGKELVDLITHLDGQKA